MKGDQSRAPGLQCPRGPREPWGRGRVSEALPAPLLCLLDGLQAVGSASNMTQAKLRQRGGDAWRSS